VAACVSYSSAQELIAKHGRGLNQGTPVSVTESVLQEEFPGIKDIPWKDIEGLTLPKFAKLYNKGHYYVRIRRHALAVVDGVIHDWKPRPKTKVHQAWRLV
jgi:hypothetical protein